MFPEDKHRLLAERCSASVERSRARREAARRDRLRRFRLRGSGASIALVSLAVGIVGAGAAAGHQAAQKSAVQSGLLKRGSKGPAVSAVQRALGLRADGVFGKSTEVSVRAFQGKRGLAVDGIVGPQTRAALGLGGSAGVQTQTGAQTRSGVQTQSGSRASAPLQQIAQCESGGNPRAIGGGGRYRGKYQFTRETWQAVGGSGDPAAAPEAEQDQRAAMLYRQGGSSQWPACGR